jgi:S-DNA-T family DNA segregation ATPase FtsK/SpoIIIE
MVRQKSFRLLGDHDVGRVSTSVRRKRRKRNTSTEAGASRLMRHLWRESRVIVLVAAALYMLLILVTYHHQDPGFNSTGTQMLLPDRSFLHNKGGPAGAFLSDWLLTIFGYVAYVLPFALLAQAVSLVRTSLDDPPKNDWLWLCRISGATFVLISACALLGQWLGNFNHLPVSAGGLLGEAVKQFAEENFGLVGSLLLLLAMLLVGLTLMIEIAWSDVSRWLWQYVADYVVRCQLALRDRWQDFRTPAAKQEPSFVVEPDKVRPGNNLITLRRSEPTPMPAMSAVVEAPMRDIKPVVRKPILSKKQPRSVRDVNTGLPSIDLLDPPDAPSARRGYSDQALTDMSALLETKLADFNIEARVEAVSPGPVVTRFEIQPSPGTKASRITNLAKDLARSLAVVSVRVVEVIPGKTVVGIEIPNQHRDMIRLSEVAGSEAFESSPSPVTLCLGKDIAGVPIVADLAKMPHLLVAGTTGSGKSVGLNAMILSMLLKATPDQLRLIMIDPKMLELSVYDDIPHLLTPVVTDMKEAANALRWCVGEMERRYRLLASLGVRNIGGFNRKVLDAIEAGTPLRDPLWKKLEEMGFEEATEAPFLEPLSYIVVVIDEFADMIMVVGKKVEELIARIAQKARAAGIHLLLATQRPSVDVITGLIKANVPTRIAFQVSSKIDSRTILDQGGAEQLLGHGDMLYLPPGTGLPMRVHGAFVSDEEVHRVCDEWRSRGEPDYLQEITDGMGGMDPAMGGFEGGANGDMESDSLYDEAVKIVTETRKASISSVQRRLKIGYNRAARMLEAMESAGVVSQMQANGSREVLAPPPV